MKINEELRDKIVKLYSLGEFQKVIDEVQDFSDPVPVFFKLQSYIALNDFQNAYTLYLAYRDDLEDYNLQLSAKLYFFLLLKLKKSTKVLSDEIEHFKCRPYVNQETEEFLVNLDSFIFALKDSIQNESEEASEELDAEQIISMFKSNDPEMILMAINYAFTNEKIKRLDLSNNVIEILDNKNEQNLAYWLLFEYLIWNHVDRNFVVKISDNYLTLNPSQLLIKKNTQARLINKIVEFIATHEKDISIRNYVVSTIDKGSYFLAPDYLTNEDELYSYVFACYRYVFKLFNMMKNDDSLFEYFKIHSNKNKSDKYYKILFQVR